MDRVNSLRLIETYDLFLLDLWGVIWLGAECRPIPGGAEFINLLRKEGKAFCFLSNTVWPVDILKEQLSEQGIETEHSQIITAGRVVSETIEDIVRDYRGKSFFHAGRDWEPEAYFTHLDLCSDPVSADVILVGDFRWREGEDIPENAVQIEKGLDTSRIKNAVICNPDRTTLQTDGAHAFQAGYFMYTMEQKFPSHEYLYIGKPYSPIYDFCLSLYPGIPPEKICMIGDSLDTDIKGADNAGIGRILVCSGNTVEIPEDAAVDFILEDLTPHQ